MSKNIDFKQFNKSGKQLVESAKKYTTFSFFIVVLCIYGFLIFRISVLSNTEPSDDEVTEQATVTKRLKIDQTSIDKIQQLKDQNVGVQSLFEAARDNPFDDQ